MTDVIIVGAGLSGLFAAAMAVERGARVRLIANGIGAIMVAPGWISVADTARGSVLEGARAIATESSDHPYALTGIDALAEAISTFKTLGEKIGLPYDGDLIVNMRLPTALGAIQTPALAPHGMALGNGQHDGALFVGFDGWRDFYPTLTGQRAAVIPLSTVLSGVSRPWDATPGDLAQMFDKVAVREAVVTAVRPFMKGATAIGFPAVIGLDDPLAAQRDLSERLGVPIFELPTLPPSTAGTRLFNRLRRFLLDNGVRLQIGHPVIRGIIENGRVRGVEVAAAGKSSRFFADAVILATGGLYGGGLNSDDRGHIWEPLFDLPVLSDPDRMGWFATRLLAPEGHPVHRFGIRVNSAMQPLNADGSPVAPNLYAIGHLLAQPGTTSTDACHEGIDLATAYKAINAVLEVKTA